MPTKKKSVKKTKGKKKVKIKKKSKKAKKERTKKQQRKPIIELTAEEREKKVVFREQTITLEEQYALEDLEKEFRREFGKFKRIEFKQFGFYAHNGNVVNLEIRNVGLKKVPDSIGLLKSLKNLTLSYNKLSSLPHSIGNLKSLQELLLHGNQLIALPDTIGNLESLTRLWLQDNKLTKLPKSLLNLSNLGMLEIKNNPLSKDSIKIWEKLMKQTGRFGDITNEEKKALADLEKEIGEPIPKKKDLFFHPFGFVIENGHVTKLGIDNKGLSKVPDSIGNLKWLKELDLGWNGELETLPEAIGNLDLLEELNVWASKLTTLPETIGNLKYLKDLDVGSNRITLIPESIGNLESLESLSLAHNIVLKVLPDSIGNLKSLRELRLEGNNLHKLPESFGNLSNLKTLTLRNYSLPKLPQSFESLNLKELVLGEYQVKDFPKELAKKLKVKGCRITYEAREWIGGWGGDWETVTYEL
ncbi:MAG: hypothetical protein ACFFCM_09000 [Promethearchaeota archaeon]